MADDKLSRKAEIDTTSFKTGIAEMNREMRVLESGFRANAAALGDWTNDANGLEMRIKSLSSQMEIQQQKVAATRAEYERIRAEKGENSRAAQDLEIKLNKETETLNKMQNELTDTEGSLEALSSGSDDAGNSVEESADKAEDASGKWEGFGNVLSGVGTLVKGTITVMASLVLAVVSVGASITGLVTSSADAAAQLVDMSAKTGISTTRLQELGYIADQTGTSLDTITGANARLVRSMDSARDQSADYAQKLADAKKAGKDVGDIQLGDAATAFQQLGVQVTDVNGNLRSNQQVFADVINALGSVQNEAERDALAMQIFGKSAQEINPLIKAGSAEMARLADQAHEVGAVMAEEDVASLEAFDDSLSSVQAGLKGTLGTLATAFLPGFQSVMDAAGGYLTEFKDIVKSSNGDIGQIVQGVGGLIGEIVTDIAAQAPQLLDAGLGLMQSLLDAILTAMPTLIPAAVNIIQSLIGFIVQALPSLIQAGIQILLALVNALVANLPMLIDAGIQAIIALALGLAAALPELIPTVVQALLTIVQTLVDNAPMLINAALQLILGLAQGLIAALPILIPQIPVIVTAIINALIAAAPMIAQAGGELLGMLVTGWIGALPMMGDAAIKVITSLVQALTSKKISLVSVGKDFINGLIEGVKNAAGYLYDAVKTIAQNMINTILNVFQQKSPSRVGINIGDNFFRSIGLGGMGAVSSVEQMFAQGSRRLIYATANGMPSSGVGSNAGNLQNSESYAFYAPVYFQGADGISQQVRTRSRRF